ncbi:MAG TPA: DNA polymerase ligase N-terminal domain-containing protein, partial [Fontimonas sp.]
MSAAARRKAARKTARKTARKSDRGTPALGLYNAKRNFGRTSEPKGARARGKGWSYVIQQHDATRMHYDFRLELDGVLLSWAVPKGPSLDPKDKRLAVQTEDHPVTYRHFEGNIPHGEYGGGPVIVWDRGTWTPDGDPRAAMKKGHLRFTLDGDKLQGGYSLVRTRGKVKAGPRSSWLLIKRDDEHVRTGRAAQIVTQRPESVVSGRTVKQVEAGKPAARLAAGGARMGRAAARGA